METEPAFLRMLSLRTLTYTFLPGDFIVYSAEMGLEMYCIRKGFVEVLAADGHSVVATLGPGTYFGEIGIIYGEKRIASVRAKTYADVIMLRKDDLEEVLETFPLVQRLVEFSNAGQ